MSRSSAQSKRDERATAASLGMTLAEFRTKYAPWRLPRLFQEPGAMPLSAPLKKKPTASRRAEVYERDCGLCRYCGVAVEVEGPSMFTVDHVVPRSRGGTNSKRNLVTACDACNQRKKDRTLAEAGMTLLEIGTSSASAIAAVRKYLRPLPANSRGHLRADGLPKVGYSREAAEAAAARLVFAQGHEMEAFPCWECNEWHVRILPKAEKMRRRQLAIRRANDLTDFDIELGERARTELARESIGTEEERWSAVVRRWRAVRKRLRQSGADVLSERLEPTGVVPRVAEREVAPVTEHPANDSGLVVMVNME